MMNRTTSKRDVLLGFQTTHLFERRDTIFPQYHLPDCLAVAMANNEMKSEYRIFVNIIVIIITIIIIIFIPI